MKIAQFAPRHAAHYFKLISLVLVESGTSRENTSLVEWSCISLVKERLLEAIIIDRCIGKGGGGVI